MAAPESAEGLVNPRATAFLALVALALGAFVYFHEIEGETARKAADADEKNLYSGLDAADVESISLVTLDGVAARFERRAEIWHVVEPVFGRAEATALDAIANALVKLPREGTIGSGGDLEDFGLGPDARSIVFEIGGVIRGLRIGGTTPIGGHRYVARLDDDEVAYVASYRVNAFNRNLADLRDRRVFHFEDGDIATLRVAWPDRAGAEDEPGSMVELSLARDAEGEWFLGSPVVGRADLETVRDVISNLTYLRTDAFIDASSAAVRRSLEETAILFHWTLDGEHLERSARLAGEVDGRRVFESAEGRLDWVPAARLEDFPRNLVAYRFRRLSEFPLPDARRLEMQFGEQGRMATSEVLEVKATLDEAGWRGEDSEGHALDPERITQLVREMSSLDAADIFAEAMGEGERASLGLNPPLATIRVLGAGAGETDAQTLAVLHIGRTYPGRGTFVESEESEAIFLLGAEALESIPGSAAVYRESFRSDRDETNREADAPVPSPEARVEDMIGEGDGLDPLEGLDLP